MAAKVGKGGQGQYNAAVDTTGMDPEMKLTLEEMRGPGSSGSPAKPKPKAPAFKFPDFTKIFTQKRARRPSTVHEKF